MAALAAVILPLSPAAAGAWPKAAGQTQVILKYERAEADQDYDAEGDAIGRLLDRVEENATVYLEHGLTDRVTLQAKAGFTKGEDGGLDYDGRGPIELGLRFGLWRDEAAVVSLYAGAAFAGEGLNAQYAPPGAGDVDVEARLLAGRSGRLGGVPAFGEVQVGGVTRQSLPDEARLDATFGLEPPGGWLILAQSYYGRAFASGEDPQWLKLEGSVVKRFGQVGVQAGWRQTVAGRRVPRDGGPVLGLWLDF
ncbi:MAG: hypothetical protein IT546_08750 [Caulobacteraceae bacterium]|nr:hypothetical protein [Caulobacteraceae bacterium]